MTYLSPRTVSAMLICALLLTAIVTPPRLVRAASPAAPIQILVTTTADDFGGSPDTCSLREAVESYSAASDFGGCARALDTASGAAGTTIRLGRGVYELTRAPVPAVNGGGSLAIRGELGGVANGDLMIVGGDRASAHTRIDAGQLSIAGTPDRAIDIVGGAEAYTHTVTLRGLTVSGGSAEASDFDHGGGIRAMNMRLSLDAAIVRDNAATGLGGAVFSNTSIAIADSTIGSGNKFLVDGAPANQAGAGAGVALRVPDAPIALGDVTLTIDASQLSGNITDIVLGGGPKPVSIDPEYGQGGAVYVSRGDALLVGPLLAATPQGPAAPAIRVSITDTIISGNLAMTGAGLAIASDGVGPKIGLTLDHTAIMSNIAVGDMRGFAYGGGVSLADVALSMRRSAVVENLAGLPFLGSVPLSYGGGMALDAVDGTIENSTIGRNTAFSDDGGFTQVKTPATFSASVFGGGVATFSSTLLLANVTIAENAAIALGNGMGAGGGVDIDSSDVTLRNSAVADNSIGMDVINAAQDIDGPVALEANNIVRDQRDATFSGSTAGLIYQTDAAGAATGTISPTDDLFYALSSPSSPTPLFVPRPGSRAIDGGPAGGCDSVTGDAALASDQRDAARVGRCDLGAAEAQPDQFFVTNTANDASTDGSLWETIQNATDADASIANPHVLFAIEPVVPIGGLFGFFGNPTQQIEYSASLDGPTIARTMTIDATSQYGAQCATGENRAAVLPAIGLRGKLDVDMLRVQHGLTIAATGVVVRGLGLTDFSRGIVTTSDVARSADDLQLACNAFGWRDGLNTVGVELSARAARAQIGGPDAAQANSFIDQSEQGLLVNEASGARIQGNVFGVGSDGRTLRANNPAASLGSPLGAIDLQSASDTLIGTDGDGAQDLAEANFFAADGNPSVRALGSDGSMLRGNRFGLSPIDELPVGGAISDHIVLAAGSQRTVVGIGDIAPPLRNVRPAGPAPDERLLGNLFGGAGTAVTIGATELADRPANTVIAGNFINIYPDWPRVMGSNSGLAIDGGALNLRYGSQVGASADPLAGNVFVMAESSEKGSALVTGVRASSGFPGGISGLTIAGNRFGVWSDDATTFGTERAIAIDTGADATTQNVLVAGNTFARPRQQAIYLGGGGTHAKLTQNSIYGIGPDYPAIELDPPAGDDNDALDADGGANDGQNAPQIASAIIPFSAAIVRGTLASAPNTSYTIELFASRACGLGTSQGEAQRYIAAQTITTDAAGDATFTFTTSPVSGAPVYTATATDPSGNTSAISPCDADNALYAAPIVMAIQRSDPSPTRAGTVKFAVQFSSDVTGVDAADFALTTTGGIAGASISGVIGSGSSYTVTVSTGSGDGTIRLGLIDDDSIVDGDGAALGGPGAGNGSFSGEVYSLDRTGPILAIESVGGTPWQIAPLRFRIRPSEVLVGLTASDIVIGGTAPGPLSLRLEPVPGSDDLIAVVSGMTGSGTVQLSIAAAAASDALGNPSAAATGPSVTFAPTVPTVTGSIRADPSPTRANAVRFTVTFDRPMTGVDVSDFRLISSGVSGAAVTSVSGSGTTYTVTVSTGSGSGTLRLDVVDDDTIVSGNSALGGPGAGNGGFEAGDSYTIDSRSEWRLFLPIVASSFSPDLRIVSMSVSPAGRELSAGEPVVVTVVVENQGNDRANPFWVDLYVNPTAKPAVNEAWYDRCGLSPCVGLAWPVAGGLNPGERVTLVSTTGYDPERSFWTGWLPSGTTTLLMFADSWNPGAAGGAVNERDEANNQDQIAVRVTGTNPPSASGGRAR